ncbi:trimeric intracellular cation channel family protein [Nakamurella leprariae]|uniref:TRIC cation channel family protein n=1 Tax=Nakamurella leprariae TaxID=2803911 RepID=A0A939C0Z4_9ACTN|nr:TRIC cation channel family protein [Nakamurella leprariae]MBM9466647.1 TRIC cation channel family protein [Nakamurella leprariae]
MSRRDRTAGPVPSRRWSSARLLLAADVSATLLFAIEGAQVAVTAHLDLFGTLAIALVASTTGGIVRDLVLGDTPPAALRHPNYVITAVLAGAVVFFVDQWWLNLPQTPIVVLDAAGLAMFAVVGAAKALDHGLIPIVAVLLGVVTGVGGGVARDLLTDQVPAILTHDIYAVAAALGAAVFVVAARAGLTRIWAMSLGAVACFALRVPAALLDWNLPRL